MKPIKLIPLVSGQVEEWANGCEQYAVHLTYDLRETLEKWPDAMPSVAFERADGKKYPHGFVIENNILHIPLMLADTAIPGLCKCVVTMTDVGGRANSDVFHGRVTQGIDSLGEEPDEPMRGIIEQVNGAAIRAEIAAKDAEGTLEEVVSAGEAKKQEIAAAGAEQIENIQSSEMVKDLIKDAISEHFEENEITSEAIGAASADALRNHEENKENPHHVTLRQLGGLPDTYVAPVASVNEKTGDVVLTAADVGALPDTYEAPVASVNGKTGEVSLVHSDVGAAPAIEDATYPGCYYRMVDGVKEWINPPLVIGEEYRTTERHEGKPVYAKMISCGAAPQTSQKSIAHNSANARIIKCSIFAEDGTVFPYISSTGNRVEGYATANYVFLNSTYNTQAFNQITAIIWYFKTTD